MTSAGLTGDIPGLVPDGEVVVGEGGKDSHGRQHHQGGPGGGQARLVLADAGGAGANHGGPEEGVEQCVGGDVDGQQLPGRAQVTLDRPGQEQADQRPDPAGGEGVPQAEEVGGGVEQDQDDQIQWGNNDQGPQLA